MKKRELKIVIRELKADNDKLKLQIENKRKHYMQMDIDNSNLEYKVDVANKLFEALRCFKGVFNNE